MTPPILMMDFENTNQAQADCCQMLGNVQYFSHCPMEDKKVSTKPDTKTNQSATEPSIMHSFKDSKSASPTKTLGIFIIIALVGVGTGFALAKYSSKTGNNIPLLPTKNSAVSGKTYGSSDTKTFKDTTEGVLKEGGIDGEGQFHLVRPGGDSQNVYMTSSTVDLSQFIGKKIKIWGETQTAQTAGWLMDVGRVEVL